MRFGPVLVALVLVLGSLDADAARRLGGGGSFGRQSSNVTQRQGTQPTQPSPQTTPSSTQSVQQPAGQAPSAAAQKAQPAQPTAAPAPAAPKRPWAGMLGGLAAGLGLAWLAHSLGFGEGFGQFLLIALVLVAIAAVIGLVLRSRRGAAASPYAFQGAGDAGSAAPLRQYNPDKIGNDASARPWERGGIPGDGAGSEDVRIGSALAGSQSWGIPAGFDTEGFIAAAKRNFITLQDAWDRADVATLRSMMTDDMAGEIGNQLADRERSAPGSANKTEVAVLNAQLLGIEETAQDYLASVEFSGMIREELSAGPNPFREVWNMTKPRDGSAGWLVAGVQALQ